MEDTIFDKLPENNIIYDIINDFDFDLVRSHMVIHNWKILVGNIIDINNIEMSIPTIEQLKNIATRILEDVIKSESNPSYISTAGFTATKWGEELMLSFSIETKSASLTYE